VPSTRGWVEAALPAACAALPACLAAAHLGNGAEAADDRAVARVLGWDPQPWRALDVVVGSVFAPAPLGNLVARAALGPVALLAVTSAVVYWLTRDLLGKCAPATRLGATVAAIAALWTGFAPSMQREATVPGGTVTGALLVLAPLALLAAAGERSPAHAASDGSVASTQDDARSAAAVVATLALALGYEPLGFLRSWAYAGLDPNGWTLMGPAYAAPGALERRVCDSVCLKVSRAGGISGLLDAARRARAVGYRVFVASTLDGPLGIAAALHAATVVIPDRACGLATLALFADRPDPLPAEAGRIAVPNGSGLGDGLASWYGA